MKILVIDDRQANLESAKIQLGNEHEVITVPSYEIGRLLLTWGDSQKAREFLSAAKESGWKIPGHTWRAFWEKFVKSPWDDGVDKHNQPLSYWDVVLTDAMMPFDGFHRNADWGQEKLVGYQLALTAAANGAKYVAVVFSNHHHQNAEGSILESSKDFPLTFANGTKLIFQMDTCDCYGEVSGPRGCGGRDQHKDGCSYGQGEIGKNWVKVLIKLTK